MALGETVRDEGVEFEVVFDGHRWNDGRVGLIRNRVGLRNSSLTHAGGEHVPSDRVRQQRSLRRTQESFEAMFLK